MAAIILRPRSSPTSNFISTLLSLRSKPVSFSILRSSISLLPSLQSPSPTKATTTASGSFSFIPDTLSSLRDLLPPWLLAVPKSKTSHSRKSMRSANKGLKEQQGVVACPSCGTPKRSHHICGDCLGSYRKEFRQEARDAAKEEKSIEVVGI